MDYNHSTFIDLIISGLVGPRAALAASFIVQPLANKSIGYLFLGHDLSIEFDAAGVRYASKGCTGLCVWVDGNIKAQSPTLSRLTVQL